MAYVCRLASELPGVCFSEYVTAGHRMLWLTPICFCLFVLMLNLPPPSSTVLVMLGRIPIFNHNLVADKASCPMTQHYDW